MAARLRLFQETGRLATAEQVVTEAAADPRNDRTALLVLLVPLFSDQGRIEDAERLIEDRWEHLNALKEGGDEGAIRLVRQHIELTMKPEPVETIRPTFDLAAQRRTRR